MQRGRPGRQEEGVVQGWTRGPGSDSSHGSEEHRGGGPSPSGLLRSPAEMEAPKSHAFLLLPLWAAAYVASSLVASVP